MKKIVISSNTCWSIYNFRLELLQFLSKNYHVEIIAPEDQYSESLKKIGFNVYHIPMVPSGVSLLQDFITIIKYFHVLKKTQPDYYLGFTAKPNIYGGFVASIMGCNVINNIAGLGRVFSRDGMVQWIVKWLYRISLRNSYHVFFQNNDDLSLFIKNNIINGRSCSVLPGSGVNVKKFKCNDVFGGGRIHKRTVFLFSSRLLLEKGICEYIDAARRIKSVCPDVVFLVLGKHNGTKDEIPAFLLRQACEENVIEYIGFTDDVVSKLSSVDCFVLPSYYREGVPRSLLEAGSCCLPLITTDSVGCKETVVDGVNGYIVPPRDAQALCSAMLKILCMSDEERRLMGCASRRHIEDNFSLDTVLRCYANVLG